MFSTKEIKFLQTELSKFVSRTQQRLDAPEVEGDKRVAIESRLITVVSILNKIEHLDNKSEEKPKVRKLLLVDDVESMRKVNRHFFMNIGFKQVDLAENGLRAFQLLKQAYEDQEPYQLIVSDWEMPKISGLELLKMVRMDKDLWKTPFYLISSISEKRHILNAINTGANGYMVKPVNQQMITEKFKSFLE
ncbi:response regulator [Catenovulum maritimum]|uniref:Response regulatory domain-containing protein n=1 Tax=Catenovulum maritimum TaxID=1513271 RepID=A0A0J8GZ98_9ALTE|nr:response regulator [Catenovulum maritimum]KMT66043.1 hypothetical protein XM47_06240 [Catenovulum maritimum]